MAKFESKTELEQKATWMSSARIIELCKRLGACAKRRRWAPAYLPMAAPLWFLSTGLVPIGLWHVDGLPVWMMGVSWALGIVAGVWAFAVGWRTVVACAGIGIAVAAVHACRPWNSYRPLIPRDGSFVEAEIVVTDTGLAGRRDLEWLNPSRRLWASVERMRTSRDQPWTSCGGRLQIYVEETQGMTYGDRYVVTGALRNPMESSQPHGFDQERYLRLKGIEHSLHVIDCRRLGASTWRLPFRWLLAARGAVLAKLLEDVGDRDRQGMLAGITFGLKNGVDYAAKRHFLLSGMIHLLAVSGLHVGILATIFMLGLKVVQVPYRIRYALLPVVLLLFVLMTGAGVSALRAWLMISIWATGKSLLRPSSPMNAVFASAFILLLINPLSFLAIGFQFSFLLVLVILSGWRFLGMLWSCIGMRSALVPGRAQRSFRRTQALKKALFMTVGAMVLFWLAGLGLSINFNRFINPAGILGNVCVTAVAWALMAVSWVKIPLAILHVPLLPGLLGGALSILIGLLEQIATVMSSDAWVIGVGKTPTWWFPTYYATLGVLVLGPPRIGPVTCRLAATVAMVFVALIYDARPSASLDVFAVSGNDAPVICIRDGDRCILVNAGGKGFDRFLTPWLEGQGIRRIDRVVCLDGRVRHCGSLASLAERFVIARIDTVVGRRPRRSWVASLTRRGVDVRHGPVRGMLETAEGEGGAIIVRTHPAYGIPVSLTFGPGTVGIEAGRTKSIPRWHHRDNAWLFSVPLEPENAPNFNQQR